MWLGHHFQGQKVNLQWAGAYCGGLPYSLLLANSLVVVQNTAGCATSWKIQHSFTGNVFIHVSLSPFLSFFHLSLSLSVSLSLSLSLSHSLSLSMLTAIFPGEPGLVSFIEAKDDGSGGDNWGYKTYKAPVKSSPPTNQHPMFYFQMPSLCLCLSYLFNCWS